jgi:hypothetical protein
MKTKVILQSNYTTTRIGKDRDLPSDFDWEWYLQLNPDLIRAGLTTREGAINHWLKHGYRESREHKDPNAIPPARKKLSSVREPFVTFSKFGSHGRLGNQMFQIAALMGYAKKYSTAYYIPKWRAENGQDLTRIFQGPFNIDPTLGAEPSKMYLEKSLDYIEIPRIADHANLHGFFQNEKYFQNCREEVIKSFSPFTEVENKIKARNKGLFENRCSIHVRRGDYIKHSEVHLNLGMDYYREAIKVMKAKGHRKFLVFSDDLDWCKNNFKNEFSIWGTTDFVFSDRNTANYEDLFLMTFCDSHIIANSTFSWWGAWLGKNPNKIVISPKKWFGPKGPQQHEVIPKNWTQI